MTSTSSSTNKRAVVASLHQEEEPEDDDNMIEKDNQFEEDNNFDTADEIDPDLYAELNSDKEERTEEKQKIKEGAEFVTKVNEGLFKQELEMQATEFSACKPWM